MDNSDKLALFAVIVAVLSAIFNYIYTRNTFQATSIPKLILSFDGSITNRDYMRFQITNPMAEVTISEVTITAHYALIPISPFKKSIRKWIHLDAYEDVEFLPSREQFSIPNNRKKSFTDHVASHFPGLLVSSTIDGEQVIEILSEIEIDLRLIATYAPALLHAKKYTTKRRFIVTPKLDKRFESHNRDILEHWRVE